MNQILITFGYFIILSAGGLEIISALGKDQYEEFNMTTVEIAQKFGYPIETHTTVTEDGYILTLHRIPHGRNPARPGYPILMQHGLFGDSSNSVLFRLRSPAFVFADAGYDVWLTNNRGTPYSRAHMTLSAEDKEFWDFSWHESGIYDLPANIDYIISQTQFGNVLYIGFSMGTTQFFVLTSERPEYQNKIRAALLWAPVAFMKHSKTIAKLFSPVDHILQASAEALVHGEFFIQTPAFQKFVKSFCTPLATQRHICRNIIFLAGGADAEEFDERGLANFLSHCPSSTSTKTFSHYEQLLKSGQFCQYDYGSDENFARYNQSSPPDYNLDVIKVPMAMFLGQNDIFADEKDVITLLQHLSTVKFIDVIQHPRFSHLDFIVAKHAKELLYDRVLERINDFLNWDGVYPNY